MHVPENSKKTRTPNKFRVGGFFGYLKLKKHVPRAGNKERACVRFSCVSCSFIIYTFLDPIFPSNLVKHEAELQLGALPSSSFFHYRRLRDGVQRPPPPPPPPPKHVSLVISLFLINHVYF